MDIRFFWIHPHLVELQWSKEISDQALESQLAVKNYLELEYAAGIREVRMGYHTLSLLLQKDISPGDWEELFEEIKDTALNGIKEACHTWRIPVCYGGDFGKDLDYLSAYHQLSIEQIVDYHVNPSYRLHFYGFLPGFMYLGGLNPILATPRKPIPDREIDAGTVAIGGQQTGIYPINSPGGWRAIGRCPLQLFDMGKPIPVAPKIGDYIRFEKITLDQFHEIQDQIVSGQYIWQHD